MIKTGQSNTSTTIHYFTGPYIKIFENGCVAWGYGTVPVGYLGLEGVYKTKKTARCSLFKRHI